MANEGWLTPNDLVWQQGMPNWVPTETVRGLFGSGLLRTLKGAVEGIAGGAVNGAFTRTFVA